MTFAELMENILSLQNLEGVDFFIAGHSLLGEPIYGAHIGSYTENQILLEGAIHAREYITAPLLVEMVKYWRDKPFVGGMYFIPLSNPDGVKLVLDGVEDFPCEKLRNFLLSVNENSTDFSLWKANANAVDLNVNFNALWGGGIQNLDCPAPGNFIGYYPNSEREVNALIEFTLSVQPALTLSYHTKGNVIYYGFETLTAEEIARDFQIAQVLAQATGYEPIQTEQSTGGYSDWVSDNLRVPAFTIEVGNPEDPHPIGLDKLPDIFERNKEVPFVALSQVQMQTQMMKRRQLFSKRFNKR